MTELVFTETVIDDLICQPNLNSRSDPLRLVVLANRGGVNKPSGDRPVISCALINQLCEGYKATDTVTEYAKLGQVIPKENTPSQFGIFNVHGFRNNKCGSCLLPCVSGMRQNGHIPLNMCKVIPPNDKLYSINSFT